MNIKQTQLCILVAALFTMIGLYLLTTEIAAFLSFLLRPGYSGWFEGLELLDSDITLLANGVGSLTRALAGLVLILTRNRLAEQLVFSPEMYRARSEVNDNEAQSKQHEVPAETGTVGKTTFQLRHLWSEVVPALALAFIGWLFVVDGVSGFVQSMVAYSGKAELDWHPVLSNRNTMLFPILLTIAKSLIGALMIRRRTAIVELWQRHSPLVNV